MKSEIFDLYSNFRKRRKLSPQRCLSNNLPHDIMLDILSRLPVKSLIKFRSVSQPWYDLVLDPVFSKLHADHQSKQLNFSEDNDKLIVNVDNKLYALKYQDSCELVEINHPEILRNCSNIRVWGSCNGLVLLGIQKGNFDFTLYLWNPSTAEYREIPYFEGAYSGKGTVYGFGYNPSVNDYEIVRITWHGFSSKDRRVWRGIIGHSDFHSHVVIYSLGENYWRNFQGSCGRIWDNCAGELVNGSLHWIAFKSPAAIIAFDIGCQKFSEVKMPSFVLDFVLVKVTTYLGKLCVLYSKNHMVDVWVMNEYGVSESWTKQFEVNRPLEFNTISDVVFCFTNKGLVLKKKDGTVVTSRKYRCQDNISIQMVIEGKSYKQSLVGLNTKT